MRIGGEERERNASSSIWGSPDLNWGRGLPKPEGYLATLLPLVRCSAWCLLWAFFPLPFLITI